MNNKLVCHALVMTVASVGLMAHAQGATAGASACTAVAGATMPALCAQTAHVAMAMEHNGQLTVQEAGPDHLLLIEEAGPSFSAFGDGGANGGQLAFQTRGVALLVAPGYQLVENSLTAIVEVTLTGSSKVVLNGQAQLGEAGKSKTVSLELSLPMNNVSMDADTNLDGIVAGGLMGPFLMQKGTGPQFLLDYAASPGGSVVGQVTKVIYRATVAAVPEPSTWAMMALGLVGLAGVRRQRR